MNHPPPPPPPFEPPTVFNTWHPWVRHLVNRVQDGNPLRPHQREAIQIIAEHFTRNQFAQIVLPTGSGKSGIAVLLPYYMNLRKVMVLAPSPDLAAQMNHQFCGPPEGIPERRDDAFFFKIGLDLLVDQDGRRQNNHIGRNGTIPRDALVRNAEAARGLYRHELFVINREKLTPRATLQLPDLPADYDLLIVDEAHHYPAQTWWDSVHHLANSGRTKVLFITATPNCDIEDRIPTIFTFRFQDAVNARAIRDIRFDQIRGPAESILEDLIRQLKTRIRELDAHIHANYPQIFNEQQGFFQAMIAAHDTVTAHRVCELYNADVNAVGRERAEACILGSDPSIVTRFKGGAFRTVVVLKRLMEGFDNPNVAFAVVARNMNPRMFNQFVGRATRYTGPEVPKALVITHVSFVGQEGNFNAMRGGNWTIEQMNQEEEDDVVGE